MPRLGESFKLTNTDIEFTVLDVITMELECSREPSTSAGNANVNINFEVVRAVLNIDKQQIVIECEYDANIVPEEQGEAGELLEPVARARARVAIVMRPNTHITSEDAESGRLNSAQPFAHGIAHPYLRTHLRQLVQSMGLPTIPIPVDIEEMRTILTKVRDDS